MKRLFSLATSVALCAMMGVIVSVPVRASSPCTTDCYVDAGSGNDANDGDTSVSAKKTIQAAVTQVAPGGTVHVAFGAYHEDVAINQPLTLLGAGIDVSTISGVSGGGGATIQVMASGVIIDGFTITRDGNNTTDWNGPLNMAGVAVQGQTNSVEVRNSKFTGNRTGIDINNSAGNFIHNNVIDFNRTGVILRNQTDDTVFVENIVTNNWTVGVLFLDASGGSNVPVQQALNSTFGNNNISGNWYGQVADRQSGGSIPAVNPKNFTYNWWGTVNPFVTIANTTEPGYAAQIPIVYGGSAIPPGGQPDIAGPASPNLTHSALLCSGTDTDVQTTPGRGLIGFQGNLTIPTFYADVDEDGFGDPNESFQACTAPPGYVSNNLDPNDADAGAFPYGSITVQKTVDSGATPVSGFCFVLTPDFVGNLAFCANGPGGDTVFSHVPLGTHSVVLTFPAGYHIVTATSSCSGLVLDTQGASQTCALHLAPNKGSITVTKLVDAGTASATNFCFTLSPDPGLDAACADAGGHAVFTDVPAGTYSVLESSLLATYHQVSSTCGSVSIVADGVNVPCVVHNTINTGTITVRKFLDSGTAPLSSFCFTLSPATANGQVCANNVTGNAVFTNVQAGTYTAIETASPANYHQVLATSTCSGVSLTTQGDTRTCAVHNALNLGTITVHKTVDAGGASRSSFCFRLVPDPGNGQVCANSATGNAVFTSVPTGTYTVDETASAPNYHLVSTCPAQSIANHGDNLVCEVHDAINTGTITVHKTVLAGGALPASFCFTLSPNFPGNAPLCANNVSGDAIFTNVPAGTYNATETTSPNTYHQVSTTCLQMNIAGDGQARSCELQSTINNGQILVHKTLDAGKASLTSFCFTVTPSYPGSAQVCTDSGGYALFNNVPAGVYTAAETARPLNYHQTSTNCTGVTLVSQGDVRRCDVHDALDVSAQLTVPTQIALGGSGTTTVDFTASCTNSTGPQSVRCSMQIAGLPNQCKVLSSGPDKKFGTADDGALITGPGSVAGGSPNASFPLDSASSYTAGQTKSFSFKLKTTCSPNLATGALVTLAFKACATGGSLDPAKPCGDADIAPAGDLNSVTKTVKLKK